MGVSGGKGPAPSMRLLVQALAVLLLLVVPVFLPAPAWCGDEPRHRSVTGKKKELEDVRKRIREEKRNIKSIEKKEGSVLGDIEDVSRSIVAARAELRRINRTLAGLRTEMASASSRIRKLEARKKGLVRRLERRLGAIYRIQKGEAIGTLFSAASTPELARRHKYLTVIMEGDSELIDEYERNIGELDREKDRLRDLSGETERERKKAWSKKRRAEAEKRRKRRLLAGVQREKSRREAMLSELKEAARGLTDLLKDLKADDGLDDVSGDGFASLRGRLMMPARGRIVTKYGKVRHPRFKTVTFNNGIVIEAPAGTSVRSVDDGRVVYTGWLKGYGQIMIIDNGGGYYTLFAYLARILKEKGEVVKRGMEVALVGDTGPRSTPGLYFEIRRRGVPKDPAPWFASRR